MLTDTATNIVEARALWNTQPALRSEFPDFGTYAAFHRAEAAGRVHQHGVGRVVRGSAVPDVEKLRGVQLSFDAEISAGSTVKLDAIGGHGRIGGYAAIFGSVNRRGFKLMANAFGRSRHSVPVPMLWMHSEPVGRWHEVRQDARGLYLRGELNLQTDIGRRALAHVEHGDVVALSVGFRIGTATDAIVEDGDVMQINDADLLEASLVPTPAEPSALIDSVR